MKEELVKLLTDNTDGLPAEPFRALNGRGGRAPGFDDLNIDVYPPLVFATVYREYGDSELSQIAAAVGEVFGDVPLIIQDRSLRPAVIRLKSGDVPDEMTVTENGLKFYLNPLRGQNPGFFIDMRACRLMVRDFVNDCIRDGAENVRVLNLFAYTAAFSVAAAAAGADRIVNIDMNRRSLEIGRRNHILNSAVIPGGYNRQALFLPHDIFKSIGRLKKEGPYRLIIADPPPSQKGSFMLLKDYPRLLRRLPEMLAPGGMIMLTHNGPGWDWNEFEAMAADSLGNAFRFGRIEPPEDFRPAEYGRGLKILTAELKS